MDDLEAEPNPFADTAAKLLALAMEAEFSPTAGVPNNVFAAFKDEMLGLGLWSRAGMEEFFRRYEGEDGAVTAMVAFLREQAEADCLEILSRRMTRKQVVEAYRTAHAELDAGFRPPPGTLGRGLEDIWLENLSNRMSLLETKLGWLRKKKRVTAETKRRVVEVTFHPEQARGFTLGAKGT